MDNVESSDNSSPATPTSRVNDSDGIKPDIVVSSPVTHSPRRTIYGSTALIKKQLQDQLNETALQLEKTANLGSALLKRKTEMEERMKELDKTEDDEVPQDLRDRIAALEQEAKALDTNTADAFIGAKGQSPGGLDISASGSSSSTATSSISTPAKGRNRYEKKGKGQKKDIELAAEIGHGLLQEVRRLTILLQEKEEGIKKLEIDKAELERTIEILTKQVRAKEEAEAQIKDDNWNLELMRQDLTNQLDELQQQLNRARNDYTKIEKALATATDVIEQLKDKEEKLMTNLEHLTNRHEKDMANNRRHVTALNREKNDLLKAVSDLKTQLDAISATKNIRKRTPEPGAEPTNGDGELSTNQEASGIPAVLQGKNLNLEETLKALNVAYRMIGSLRANLQKEKSEKYEVKKLLSDSQEQIEMMRHELHDLSAIGKANKKSQNGVSGTKNGPTDVNGDEESNDFEDSQSGDDDVIIIDDGEDEIIDKNNRPSSDMFKPRRRPDLISKNSRTSRGSGRTSSLLSRISNNKIDEDIPGVEEDEVENTEEVKARRAETLNILDPTVNINSSTKSSKSPQMSMNSQDVIEEPNSYDSTSNNRESVVRKIVNDLERNNSLSLNDNERKSSQESGNREREIKDDDFSSVYSFASANETNAGSNRGSKEPVVSKKTFRHVEVQTDPVVERSDSLSTIYTGKFTFGNRDTIYDTSGSNNDYQNTRQSVLLSPDDNSMDIKRFTLDLSSQPGHQTNVRSQQRPPVKSIQSNTENEGSQSNNQQDKQQNSNKPIDQVSSLDPPPRPSVGPPKPLVTQTQRPAPVNFGQQAGSPKIPQSLSNIQGQRGSDDLHDSSSYPNGSRSRGIGNTHNELSHHHTPSSGSVSTTSSTSTSPDATGRRSDSSHQDITGPGVGPTGTDPNIIHAITQTMIGEYLYKYTRSKFGGISDKRHKRFFWVHPYTKTLYWSNKDPGSYEPTDPKSKSGMSYFAYIESVDQVPDLNPSPPGIYQMSLVIKTPERELKFTAPSKERHDYWYTALSYLLQRHDETGQGQAAGRPSKVGSDPWDSQNSHNLHANTSPNGSLKGNNLREVKKKSSFSKLNSLFRRQDASSSLPNSPLSTESIDGQSKQLAVPGSSQNGMDDEDEDLENQVGESTT
ncbi:10255_t:CDS:2 [Acaulospora morrowiae]|uniref:10255_t:CDS:1 n=1 Tax=Acaulospora morrowiae TaxID=94023 RepID=A0A9N8VCZ6_9GLOM|nr:10255_t:CDS:2 [Acaulospora morrowiae]